MCRLLAIRAEAPVDIGPWIDSFAEHCRTSQEYQGDGWGVSWWDGDAWARYRSTRPLWDDWDDAAAPTLPASTVFLVHARSAFRDDDVVLERNMPFVSGDLAFAFNGELRGVRLAATGANGAASLFNLFDRFRSSASSRNCLEALHRLDAVVEQRTRYVRALNIVVSDGQDVWINTRFSEDPDYFTLHESRIDGDGPTVYVVSSERLTPSGADVQWRPIPNETSLTLGGTH